MGKVSKQFFAWFSIGFFYYIAAFVGLFHSCPGQVVYGFLERQKG
jgi:hypothetical protein